MFAKTFQERLDQLNFYVKKRAKRNPIISNKVLQESEKRFQDIATSPDAWSWEIDAQGRYSYATPIVENVLGYKPEEIRGKYFYDFFHDNERYELKEATFEFFARKKRLKDFINRNVTKAGQIVVLETNGSPILSEDGELLGYRGSSRDVTERTRLEEESKKREAQFVQAQKMEAIGRLASSISHDFNNIFQAVWGCIDLLSMKKGEDDPDRHYLNQIDKLVRRGVEVTNQLLTFSGKAESQLRPIDLNREVMHAVDKLGGKIPQMIDIELRLADDLKRIDGDPMQLEQVMINLGINAKDRMPDGGRLIFQTEDIILNKEHCRTISEVRPGEYVVLTVSDTGHSIDEETTHRIFEPFYAVKGTGKGPGLGVAMVYGIIKNHGASITCRSEPERGTTFEIYFPALELKEIKKEPAQKKEGATRDGQETILLVDDEKALLDLGRNVLEKHGYRTVLAESGEGAIEIYKRAKEWINLVVLDISMPGMGGHKCLEELLRINPEVKVIIASGYSGDAKLKEALEAHSAEFLRKPYSLTDMLEQVRKVLDRE
jgi:PAS domain S-box-containing protein